MSDTLILSALVGSLASIARINNPRAENDYESECGLLYCGKCNTAKEFELEISASPLTIMKVPVSCECRKEQQQQDDDHRKKREEMRRISDIKTNSLIDEKFKDATFETAQENQHNKKQIKLCRSYAERFDEMLAKNQGLIFHGNVGTGKTHMAACIANFLTDRLIPCVMTSFVKILQNVQGFKGEENEQQFITKLNKAQLLIIDDLGAERSTDYALEKVYNIIDSRYCAKKPMILTTNQPIEEMKNSTDPRYLRIYDRIFEVCYPVEFKGSSWRKNEAAKRHDEIKKFIEG